MKKRNPQDATRRNVRASIKRDESLEAKVERLTKTVERLAYRFEDDKTRIDLLTQRVVRLERGPHGGM